MRDLYGYSALRVIPWGYNKYHTHEHVQNGKVKWSKPMAKTPCSNCDRNLSEYRFSDLETTIIDNEIHYNPKSTAKKSMFKSFTNGPKESQMYSAATPDGQVGQYYWHVHHEKLVEKLTEPIKNRIDYVKATKKDALETRLHFMRPVKTVPAIVTQAATTDPRVTKAKRIYDEVSKAYYRGKSDIDSYNRAYEAYTKASRATSKPSAAEIAKAWEAQHKIECFHYCPWNGQTLLARPYGKQGQL